MKTKQAIKILESMGASSKGLCGIEFMNENDPVTRFFLSPAYILGVLVMLPMIGSMFDEHPLVAAVLLLLQVPFLIRVAFRAQAKPSQQPQPDPQHPSDPAAAPQA